MPEVDNPVNHSSFTSQRHIEIILQQSLRTMKPSSLSYPSSGTAIQFFTIGTVPFSDDLGFVATLTSAMERIGMAHAHDRG